MPNTYLDFDISAAIVARKTAKDTSAGAGDAGKIVALNSLGLVDTSMLPSSLSGSVPLFLGWYYDDFLITGDGIGPVYQTAAAMTVVKFTANVKTAPSSTCTLDVQTSTNYTTWTTIFSTKPTISSGSNVASNGTLSVTSLAIDTYVRFCVVATGSAASVTVQVRVTPT